MDDNIEIKHLKKSIKKAKTVFLMAHKNLDLDALGSCLGMYYILSNLKKDCYIIIDDKDKEMGVDKVLHEVEGCYNIIKSSDLPIYLNKKQKNNLLIILDTNKKDLLQNKECLDYFKQILIIDHHEQGKTTIKDVMKLIDSNFSSACELVVKISELFNIEFTPYIATLLLSGIVLDTNNFTLNTDDNTFYTAYYLTAIGASPKKVQYLLKQEISDYIEQQKLLTNIEMLDKKIAIAKGTPYVTYRREDLAKTADTLLFFNNVEASFVIGKIGKTTIGISARSLGNYDIEKILIKFGGGSNKYNGAAIIENKNISEVLEKLRRLLKEEE